MKTTIQKLGAICIIMMSSQFMAVTSGQNTVNFDALLAPPNFSSQTDAADDYSDGFVTFAGNWKVLDCTNQGLTGFSPRNALKWNNVITSSKESINFPTPVSNVSFKIGTGSSSTSVTIKSYNSSGVSVDLQNINLSVSGLETVLIPIADISRIDVTANDTSSGFLDDISYTGSTIPTMSQWALMILGLILTSLAVVRIRKVAVA